MPLRGSDCGRRPRKAGLNLLNPTNADGDSGKQITDVRNLVGAGAAKGLGRRRE